MAYVELYTADEAATTAGYCEVTHRRFESTIFDLLPRGHAWDRNDPVLQALVAAQATELSRVDKRGEKLRRELNPATTFELVTDWEEMLGLPECTQPETLEARRAAILAKLLAQGGHDQSLTYWEGQLEALGYVLEWIDKGQAAMTCEDDCLDVLYDEEWLFVWSINVESGIDDALLECIVEHQALIETWPIVHVLWQLKDIPPNTGVIHGIASSTTGYTVAVGEAGLVLTATPELAAWTTITPPTASDFYCVCEGGIDGDRLVAAGAIGVAWYSDDGGESWMAATDATAIDERARGVSRGHAADAVVVAVGGNGGIWRSTDAGDNWTDIASPTSDNIHAVTRCTGAMIAVGFDGQIIRSTNSGSTWSFVVNDSLPELFGVAGWGSTVIAVGEGGVIKRSADAGLTWADIDSPVTSDLRAVTRSAAGRWTACGVDGVILQSLDDGLTWLVREVDSTADLWAAGASWPFGRAATGGDDLVLYLE